MKIKHLILPVLPIAAVLLLGSCNKKNEASPSSNVPNHYEIDFNASTIDINTVDSVAISFNLAGGPTITKKMQRVANVYSIGSVGFGDQPVNIQIIVYTPKCDNVQGDKPVRSFVYDIAGATSVAINGPSDKKGDVWKPRFIFSDMAQHVRLTISEDQKDPYFSLRVDNPESWSHVHFQKAILASNNTAIDDGLWEIYSTDTVFPQGVNTIVNTTNFDSYAARIANKNWDKEDIYLLIINNDPGKYVILHSVYEKR